MNDLIIKRFLHPFCAVCNGKPVDRWEIANDFQTRELVCVAWCHGEIDRCRISDKSIFFHSIMPGYAFTMKMIENRRDELLKKLPIPIIKSGTVLLCSTEVKENDFIKPKEERLNELHNDRQM